MTGQGSFGAGLGELVEHVHGPWVHPVVDSPLLCEGCGELWPGAPLPEPYLPYEGYGQDRAGHTPWRGRINAMLNELAEREEDRDAAIQRELAMVAP